MHGFLPFFRFDGVVVAIIVFVSSGTETLGCFSKAAIFEELLADAFFPESVHDPVGAEHDFLGFFQFDKSNLWNGGKIDMFRFSVFLVVRYLNIWELWLLGGW